MVNHWHNCPESLCSLHPWRFSKHDLTKPSATWSIFEALNTSSDQMTSRGLFQPNLFHDSTIAGYLLYFPENWTESFVSIVFTGTLFVTTTYFTKEKRKQKSNPERKNWSKIMCKSYTKTPVSQSCWLLLVFGMRGSIKWIKCKNKQSEAFCSQSLLSSYCFPTVMTVIQAVQSLGWGSKRWITLTPLSPLQWSHIENRCDWKRLGPVYKGKSLFNTALCEKELFVFVT